MAKFPLSSASNDFQDRSSSKIATTYRRIELHPISFFSRASITLDSTPRSVRYRDRFKTRKVQSIINRPKFMNAIDGFNLDCWAIIHFMVCEQLL